MRLSRIPSHARQRGVALIISLIFLLLLTLIAVSAMQGTILQERMAGNTRNQMLAFQAAEAALSAGETQLAASGLPSGAGYYMNPAALPSATYTSSQDWVNTFSWSSTTAATYTGSLNGVAAPPQFVVERLTSTPPSCKAPCSNNTQATTGSGYYRITARGVGGTTNAVAVLQEVYARP